MTIELPFLPYDSDANDNSPQKDEGLFKAVAFSSVPLFRYIRRVFTLPEFAAYVQGYDFGSIPPSYIVIHHTAIPDASWAPMPGQPIDRRWDFGEQGMDDATIAEKRLRQLDGIKNYYQNNLGWTAGPHLFVDDKFVYAMTPMYDVGIHAAQGNSTHVNGKLAYSIGIEVVGCYTSTRWPEVIQANVRGVVQTLHDRLGTFQLVYKAGPGFIAGHRAYNKPSCPGDAITNDFIIQVVTASPANDTPTENSPILAPPRCTTQQAIAYMLARTHANYTNDDIARVIIPTYFAVCQSVGVDPCVAIAQMIHETGNLSSVWDARPHRNPAGIGVTGEPGKGMSFATWANDAIPAHVGRLLAYALPKGSGTPAQQALIDKALAVRALPDDYRGCAPTLRGLNGRWAVPGTMYATAIARIVTAIQKS